MCVKKHSFNVNIQWFPLGTENVQRAQNNKKEYSIQVTTRESMTRLRIRKQTAKSLLRNIV